MRNLVLALVAIAPACSGNADIGVDSQPVTCMPQSTAEVHGAIDDPHSTNHFAFDAGTPSARNANQAVNLHVVNGTNDLLLDMYFLCGQPQIAQYDVIGGPDQAPQCPLEVEGVIGGQLQSIGASSGVLIIDQNSNCLAGRFHVDFGNAGSVAGWFSTPWQ